MHAVTRLDVSNNQLTELPSCVWTMQSLKFLSAAQNKIEFLPQVSIAGGTLRKKKKGALERAFRSPLQRRDTEVSTVSAG